MSKLLPFDKWPDDHFERTYQAEDALGSAFVTNLQMQMQFIKKKCAALAPAISEGELESVVVEAAFGGMYALLMVLDGVAETSIDAEHGIEWSAQARILRYGGEIQSVQVPVQAGGSVTLGSFRPNKTEYVETVEVLPKGDGLCYAYHRWKEDYKTNSGNQEQQNDTDTQPGN